jgi:cell division septation protein DedD
LVIGLTIAGLLVMTALAIALKRPFGNREQLAESTREAPIIKADDRPLKVRPDEPGGMEVPNRDMLVYRRLEGANEKQAVERLLPEPEQPVSPPRPVAKPEPKSELLPSQSPQNPERLEDSPPAIPPVKPTSEPVSESRSSPAETAAVATGELKAPETGTSTPAVAQATGAFQIQLAALRSQEQARGFWNQLRGKYAQILTELDPNVVQADLGDKGVIYRLRAGPIGSEDEAKTICDALKAHKTDCLVVRPGG